MPRATSSAPRRSALAHSQNPIYAGFTLSLLGAAVRAASLFALALVPLFFIVTDRWYVRFEAQVMTERFEERYERYRERVRRWV